MFIFIVGCVFLLLCKASNLRLNVTCSKFYLVGCWSCEDSINILALCWDTVKLHRHSLILSDLAFKALLGGTRAALI